MLNKMLSTRANLTTWCCLRKLKHLNKMAGLQNRGKFITNRPEFMVSTIRHFSISRVACNKNYVAIIGSGPAGFYTAQQILKGNDQVRVDIFEKLPVPFGLVRFGVAPDHPEVKNVINTFTQTAHKDRFQFWGNVDIGKDISLDELRKVYSAVVLCYGAPQDRRLGIPGEDLVNSMSARSFVGWYNGLPEDRQLPVDLDCENAVVLGHGNVALDAARMLLTPTRILEKTDIAEHALEVLRKSRVKRVYVVGRRGPLQVAFTIKELREMIRLDNTRTLIDAQDVAGLDKVIKELPRPRRRLTELLYKSGCEPSDADLSRWSKANREWKLMFHRTPLAVLGSADKKVQGVEFGINKLEGDNFVDQKAVLTDLRETIDCGLVLRSIGYKSQPLDSNVPFNDKTGTIRNHASRVEGQHGLYCSGWASNGPVGVILTTMTDGFETGKEVVKDLLAGHLQTSDEAKRSALLERLQAKVISFQEWEKIDAVEMDNGKKFGKPREKLVAISDMLNATKTLAE